MTLVFIGHLWVVFEDGQAIAHFVTKREAVRFLMQAEWIALRA
jgi:hypothetical protein